VALAGLVCQVVLLPHPQIVILLLHEVVLLLEDGVFFLLDEHGFLPRLRLVAVIISVFRFASSSQFAVGFLTMFGGFPWFFGPIAACVEVEFVDAVDEFIGLIFE
jgi:hypothetical protein